MNTVRPRQIAIDTPDGAVAGALIDGAANVVEGNREVARHPGDQPVGVAESHHAGGEHVAVVVDQPLAVARQKAGALQPFIEEARIFGVAAGQPGIEYGHALVELEPSWASAAPISASRPIRIASPSPEAAKMLAARIILSSSPSVNTMRRGRHANLLEYALERSGDRVEARRKSRGVVVEVGDGMAGDARIHGRLGDGDRNGGDQARIERHGDEVFRPEAQARAVIGRRHFIGHVFARQLRPAPRRRRSSSPR